jgi:hypothetical protein
LFCRFKSDRSKPSGVDTVRVADKDPRDFVGETQTNQRFAKVTLRFDVFNWTGQPKDDDPRYVVKVMDRTDDSWRKFGITDMEHYGMIISNTPQLGLHVNAKLWDSTTLNHESNKPEEMAKAVAKDARLAR